MYINEELVNKLEHIIDYETTQKQEIVERIERTLQEIENTCDNPYSHLSFNEVENGYNISGYYYGIGFCKFAFTLSEIIIHLRYMK